jgi:hypothetical protein
MVVDVEFVQSTLSRYANARTKRVGAALHRQLALAAKSAGCVTAVYVCM